LDISFLTCVTSAGSTTCADGHAGLDKSNCFESNKLATRRRVQKRAHWSGRFLCGIAVEVSGWPDAFDLDL